MLGDGDSVLEVRRKTVILRNDGPLIFQGARLSAARVDHRLNGDDHAWAHLGVCHVGGDIIRDEWFFVHLPTDAMSGEVTNDTAPL